MFLNELMSNYTSLPINGVSSPVAYGSSLPMLIHIRFTSYTQKSNAKLLYLEPRITDTPCSIALQCDGWIRLLERKDETS